MGAILAAGLVAALGPGGTATAQVGTSASVDTIAWQACAQAPVLECGTVTVPVNWADPGGPTTGIAVARRKATGQRIGSLFINPGGAGNSGVYYAMVSDSRFSAELNSRFDIIGFDPRGTVRSAGVQCDPDLVDNPPVSEYPQSPGEFQAMKDYHLALGRSCAERTGPVFEYLDTVSAARDMDAIRAALGEEKISYYGVSYGTLLGQMYAELFTDRIRAMVLDSVLDHTEGLTAYQVTGARAIETQFLSFARWAGTTPQSPLYGQDVVALWDRLYLQATNGQLKDPADGSLVSPEALGQVLVDNFANPVFYWDAADYLAALAGTAAGATRGKPTVKRSAVDPDCFGFCFDANTYRTVLCEDFEFGFTSYRQVPQLRRRMEQVAPHTKMNVFNYADATGCSGWPSTPSNPQHRLVFGSASQVPPILVATSRADAITPYEWARSVSDQIPNSRLLVYEGDGHNTYRRAACMQQHQDRYLIDLTVPSANTTCAAAPVPPRPANAVSVATEPAGR